MIKTMKAILAKDRKDNPGREEWKIAECKEKRAIRNTFEYIDKYNYPKELIEILVQKMKYTTNSDEVRHYIDSLHKWIKEK